MMDLFEMGHSRASGNPSRLMDPRFRGDDNKIHAVVDVAVPLPLPILFSYFVPQELEEKAKRGVRVRIPLKNREIMGYIVSSRQSSPEEKLKAIAAVLDDEPVLSDSMLELTRWISEYYGASWGESIENALPRWVKYGKRAQRALERRGAVPAPGSGRGDPAPTDVSLSDEQNKAFSLIQKSLQSPSPKPILIFGVTGSGKSELYIRVIREVLAQGKAAICLVPEIALTEQLKRFFHHHFDSNLEVLHSKMTHQERFIAWKSIEAGTCRVILGPRSAVFAPCQNLGVVIMDEEHEGSYKQETVPRYHAREVAMWRSKREGALFIMGTATPSLETMARTESGEIERMELTERIGAKPMPAVQVIDLKEYGKRRFPILSPPLAIEIEANLKKKQGTLLLLNRRGFSTFVHCPSCGGVESCESCHVSLTFHQEEEKLLCHYCNYEKPASDICTSCKIPVLRFAGFGTEKVESEVAARFPGARIARMDTDSIRKRGSHEEILSSFRNQQIDILVGTQMIAKGFDFPHVTLVGVILADVGLALPDFRSAERTFQLLAQVAGRAGRGQIPGRVLIQTYSPDHPSVRCAKHHDFPAFYEHEKKERAEYGYPPSTGLINVIVRGKDENKSYQFARMIRDELHGFFTPGIEIIGPAPLPFFKLRGHFRWHVMIKNFTSDSRGIEIQRIIAGLKKPAGTAMAIDVDPLNIL